MHSSSTSSEPSEEFAMFARLLPISIAESESSKLSTIFTATLARFEPSSRAFSSLMRLHEE